MTKTPNDSKIIEMPNQEQAEANRMRNELTKNMLTTVQLTNGLLAIAIIGLVIKWTVQSGIWLLALL